MHRASGYALLMSLLMVMRTHRTGAVAEESSLEYQNKGIGIYVAISFILTYLDTQLTFYDTQTHPWSERPIC